MMTKPTIKYMDLAGALKELKDGKKVRREAWFTHAAFPYIKTRKDHSRVILVHWTYGEEKDTYWEPKQYDLFGEDWVVVE